MKDKVEIAVSLVLIVFLIAASVAAGAIAYNMLIGAHTLHNP